MTSLRSSSSRSTTRGRRRAIAAAAITAAATLALTACSTGSGGQLGSSDKAGPSFDLKGQSVRITLGDDSAQSLGNRYMISQLKKWGANVDTITLTTATGLSALVANQADFAAGQGADESILGLSKKTEVTAVGAPDSADSYVIIANKNIKSIADLKGKNIATSGPGGFNTALAEVALKKSGVDPDSQASLVTIGGSPERAQALLTGRVDATVVFYSDWAQIEAKSPNVHLLSFLDKIVPDIPDLYYYGKTSYWKAHPEVATAVACANLSANSIISKSKKDFVKFAQSQIKGSDAKVTGDVYDELVKLGNWPTKPDQIMNSDGLDNLQTLMIQSGEIDKKVDTSGLVDLSYLKKAAKMGCGA